MTSIPCVADFCLVPVGAETSVTKYVAECQKVLEKSGLVYKLQLVSDGYGTNVEGPWDDVMRVIRECHEAVHSLGAPRIATDIRIGTRVDKSASNAAKVQSVVDYMAKSESDS